MKNILLILMLFFTVSVFSQNKSKSLSDLEIQQLLDEHNKWREEVGNEDLVWSDELAKIAQQWADKLAKSCTMYHSTVDYGENIYWTDGIAIPEEVVNLWADERFYYAGEEISEKNYMKVGHYTQMVWYETTEVGCAKAKCKNGGEIWVCNYNPAGNYVGEKAYGN